MRTIEILHSRIGQQMEFMHATRWRSLCRTVQALLEGQKLWLTALGRARGSNGHKHSIKAVDRLLGNPRLHEELPLLYRALTHMLVKKSPVAVVLVDTVEIRHRVFAITASLAFDGRAFPFYSVVTAKGCKPPISVLRRFLNGLEQVLPPTCRPVLITDAGFESGWFDAVASRGWDFVGRVRNCTQLLVNGKWMTNKQLHAKATNKPKNLGSSWFPKSRPQERRLVLSKKPKRTGRRRITRSGHIGRRTEDKSYAVGAKQPWLLATSLTCSPSHVVALFATRMQIEENYRDTKNSRWGWSLRHSNTRSRKRFDVLLAIGTLASFIQQTIGLCAERLGLHRRYQANTESRRRVLSFFTLGRFVLRSSLVLPLYDIGLAIQALPKVSLLLVPT